MSNKSAMRVVIALCFTLLSACAHEKAVMRYNLPAETQIWPSPPEHPRYQFSGVLLGESNFLNKEAKRNYPKEFFAWVVGLVLGEDKSRQLLRPQSGYYDEKTKRIYVTDVGRKAVFVFDEALGELSVWESAGKNLGFISPIAITAGVHDELWVTDADLSAIVRLSASGQPLGTVQHAQLKRPTGIARDASRGVVYVADSAEHDIKVFSDAGELLRIFGKKGDAQGLFNGPTHLAFAQNTLYVTDTLNARVQEFSSDGQFIKTFGKRGLYLGDMPRPKGIALDGAGRLYVVESYHDYLLVYDAEGDLLLPIGGTGQGAGQFYLPAGVWTDGHEQIFVADMFNGRVERFTYIGDQTPDTASNNHTN